MLQLGEAIIWLTYFIASVTAKDDPLDPSEPDFLQIATTSHYIDKTLFIEDVITHSDNQRVVLAPSGFGKSLHMSMLRHFFQIPLDDKGNKLPREKSKAYPIFKSKKIGQSEYFRDFGTRGVVFLDFKDFRGFKNYDEFITKFHNIVRRAFREHKYLLRNASTELDLSLNTAIFRRCGILDDNMFVNGTILEMCCSDLPQLIQNHLGKRVILLIDSVSVPFETMLENPDGGIWLAERDPEADRIAGTIQVSLSAMVKGNHGVWRSFLSGVNSFQVPYPQFTKNITFTSIFSTKTLASSYGFSQTDLDYLAGVFGLNSSYQEELKDYWDGYSTYTETDTIGPIYCPGFVIKYLTKTPRPQLTPSVLLRYSPLRPILHLASLLRPNFFGNKTYSGLQPGGEIETTYKSKISFRCLINFRKARFTGKFEEKYFNKTQRCFLMYLLEQGFFTGHFVYEEEKENFSLKIANGVASLLLAEVKLKDARILDGLPRTPSYEQSQ